MSDPSLSTEQRASNLLERVDELASALFDHQITEEQIRELSELLAGNPEAQSRYIENTAMHMDLIQHFGSRRAPTPVLGMLGDVANSVGIEPPVMGPPVIVPPTGA